MAAAPRLLQGLWRRQPFEETALEEVAGFVVAEDCGEEVDVAALPAKLASSLEPGPEGQWCQWCLPWLPRAASGLRVCSLRGALCRLRAVQP